MRRGETVIGKYRLVAEIGSGGMGVVWEARHVVTDRPFAIKFLSGPAREEHYARFLQEARVSGLVRHPSIVDVYDVGSAPELGGVPFLVMDLLDGVSLKELLAIHDKLSVRQTLQFMVPIVSAVAAAHEAGVIHRDLKPSNLFLHKLPTGALVPKVLDFGISKLVGPARRASGSDNDRRLTRTGAVLGSPLYMSPEQVRGDITLDARSDVHAVGTVLWECLTGKLLWKDDLDDRELAAQIANGERPSLSDVWPDCPPALSRLVARCVLARREDRFGSARELLVELERLHDELAPGASLSDPREASALFSVLVAPKKQKPLEHATTIDSDVSDKPAPFQPVADTIESPRARSAGSIEGWVDKPSAPASAAKPRDRTALLLALSAVVVVGVLAFAGGRGLLRGSQSREQPAEAPPPPASPSPPPEAVVPPTSPPAEVPAAASAALPATPADSAATQAAARPNPRHPAPPRVPTPPRTDPHAAPSASAPDTIGTSANGSPIIR